MKEHQGYIAHRSAQSATELCFPAANAVSTALQAGKVDASLPETLRTMAYAIEALTLSQAFLLERVAWLEDEASKRG